MLFPVLSFLIMFFVFPPLKLFLWLWLGLDWGQDHPRLHLQVDVGVPELGWVVGVTSPLLTKHFGLTRVWLLGGLGGSNWSWSWRGCWFFWWFV